MSIIPVIFLEGARQYVYNVSLLCHLMLFPVIGKLLGSY